MNVCLSEVCVYLCVCALADYVCGLVTGRKDFQYIHTGNAEM